MLLLLAVVTSLGPNLHLCPRPGRSRPRELSGQVRELASSRVLEIIAAATVAAGEAGDGGSVPRSLCLACAEYLPVSGAGLALMSERGPEGLVAATDGPATVMEELQITLGEGPCVDASTTGQPVLQPDLSRTGPQRWPGFGPAALEAGIKAIFAFPLHVGRIRLGVLDLYRDSPGPLTPDQLTESLAYADAAASVLLSLQARQPADGELHPDLIDPHQDLAEVHQATGMIAVQAAVGLAEALLLLRAHAYASGRSILAVANDVLNRDLRLDPEQGHHG